MKHYNFLLVISLLSLSFLTCSDTNSRCTIEWDEFLNKKGCDDLIQDPLKIHDELIQNPICQFCKQKYLNSRALNTHIRLNHPSEKTSYICPFCDEKFHYKKDYIAHLSTAYGLKNKEF